MSTIIKMIKNSSPFTYYANAVIHLPRVLVGVGVDRYGNQSLDKEIIDYQCLLEPGKADTMATQYMPGINTNNIFLSGYLINPYYFPSDISFPCDADVELKTAPGKTQIGKIRLLPVMSDPYLLKTNVDFINKVKGWFYY
jgi:hypothetical protein